MANDVGLWILRKWSPQFRIVSGGPFFWVKFHLPVRSSGEQVRWAGAAAAVRRGDPSLRDDGNVGSTEIASAKTNCFKWVWSSFGSVFNTELSFKKRKKSNIYIPESMCCETWAVTSFGPNSQNLDLRRFFHVHISILMFVCRTHGEVWNVDILTSRSEISPGHTAMTTAIVVAPHAIVDAGLGRPAEFKAEVFGCCQIALDFLVVFCFDTFDTYPCGSPWSMDQNTVSKLSVCSSLETFWY